MLVHATNERPAVIISTGGAQQRATGSSVCVVNEIVDKISGVVGGVDDVVGDVGSNGGTALSPQRI